MSNGTYEKAPFRVPVKEILIVVATVFLVVGVGIVLSNLSQIGVTPQYVDIKAVPPSPNDVNLIPGGVVPAGVGSFVIGEGFKVETLAPGWIKWDAGHDETTNRPAKIWDISILRYKKSEAGDRRDFYVQYKEDGHTSSKGALVRLESQVKNLEGFKKEMKTASYGGNMFSLEPNDTVYVVIMSPIQGAVTFSPIYRVSYYSD